MYHISCNSLNQTKHPLHTKCKENSKDGKDGKDGKEDMNQPLLPLSATCSRSFLI